MSDRRQFIVSDKDSAYKLTRFIEVSLPAKLRVTVEPYRARRRVAQNNLWWLWISILARHLKESTGEIWAKDDLHEALKVKLLGQRAIELGGEVVSVTRSTAALTVVEFSDLLNDLDHYCQERWNLTLPHPEDLYGEAHG